MANVLRAYANVSAADFAVSLAESGLLDPAAVDPDSAPNGVTAARQLVEAGRLTGYQAEAVLGRRFGDLRIGNYDVLDRLGAGGMGAVFKARHRRMKRVVALKVFSPEAAALADRFQREVETISRLTHPNIVMAYDADEAEVGPFLVMEFVDGRDLASEVAERGPLAVADAVGCLVQAARGLEYAHQRGIIHRDVKPGNILRGRDGVVKVADLGLARLNAPETAGQTALTQTGTVFGTPDYMPPEQAVDAALVDRRGDVYSLGCTLCYLLTGLPPYRGSSLMALLLMHREGEIPSLTAARPDVPPALDRVFQKMVAKAPADRYQSMGEVAAALESSLAPVAPAATQTGVWENPIPPSVPPPKTDVFPGARAAGLSGAFEVSPAAALPAGLTVVLAEPSRTQAGIIRRYLLQIGAATVLTTGSGREALELAKRARVIVSSMHLADMTGTQLAATLLADPGCRTVGFVLATSDADTVTPGTLPASPRVAVMPKPFDPDRLARSIAAVVA